MVSVVILAAGFGTRMKSSKPKVLHEICGKSMIEYVIMNALQISSDIHVILFNQKERIQAYLTKQYAPHILDKITFHTQPHDRYPGTGGALMNDSKELINLKGEKVVILSADTPLISSLDICKLIEGKGDNNLCFFTSSNPKGYGRIVAKNNQDSLQSLDFFETRGIIEDKDCTPMEREITAVNAGIYSFKKSLLQKYVPMLQNNNAQNEYYLTDIIALSVADGKSVFAYLCDEKNVLGVNTKIQLATAENIMLERLRSNAMLQGVSMQIPESIYLDYDVSFEGECFLENGVRITGKTYIKESTIKAYSVIEQSEIISSDVGPHAHIRPNSVIIDSHIGNFVECKNAKLQGVKAGHLSYLGDCEILDGTNIGAGVITCNYDGIAKHKTHIGKNVFVGSDCQLIAPIKVEDNVLIGAGSTVTKNIKKGSLALTRATQKEYEEGYYKFFKKQGN